MDLFTLQLTITTIAAIIMGYNNNYASALHRRLSSPSSINSFKSVIADEIRTIGLTYWSYTIIEIPLKLAIYSQISNLSSSYRKDYIKGSFDPAIEHFSHRNGPVYLSSISNSLRRTRLRTEGILRLYNYISMCKAHGLCDTYYFLIPSRTHSSRIFSISTTNDNHSLPHTVKRYTYEINTIAETVDRVGSEHFPNEFLQPKTDYDSIVSSLAYKVILHMTYNNVSLQAASKYYAEPIESVEEQLNELASTLGETTVDNLFIKLRTDGYF